MIRILVATLALGGSTIPYAPKSNLGCDRHEELPDVMIFQEIGTKGFSCSYLRNGDSVLTIFDYIESSGMVIPIKITHGPNNDGSDILYVSGGPRTDSPYVPDFVRRLALDGHVVYTPIYHGKLFTDHPNPDIEAAARSIESVCHQLIKCNAVISASAGSYVYMTSAIEDTNNHVMLMPLLTAPRNVADRLGWGGVTSSRETCLWHEEGHTVCDSPWHMYKSFWGKYFNQPVNLKLSHKKGKYFYIVGDDDNNTTIEENLHLIEDFDVDVFVLPGGTHRSTPKDRSVIDHISSIFAEVAVESDGGSPSPSSK